MCTCMYLSADGNRLKVLYNDEVAGSCFESAISYTQLEKHIHRSLLVQTRQSSYKGN